MEYTTLDHIHDGVNFKPKADQVTRDKIYNLRMNYDMKPAKIHRYLRDELQIPSENMFSIRHIRHVIDSEKSVKIALSRLGSSRLGSLKNGVPACQQCQQTLTKHL